jgi:glutamate-1-semialdehyde 2,1-aminomutase/spore coat polysaccharide biosynthesis protein SpsF
MIVTKSKELQKFANSYISLGVQTLSKSPTQYTQKYAPSILKSASGPFLYDVDGNEWIDYVAALGPIVLGYGQSEVVEAATEGLKLGAVFSLSHESEAKLAKVLCDEIPFAEMVRFGKNGSDVTAAGVRAARAYTGREQIAICGYHGWQDWYIGTTTKNKGVPVPVKELSHTFTFNDIESLRNLFKAKGESIAAVVMESIAFDEPAPGFLEAVREECNKHGALLIFDEVINGFRLAPCGGAQFYGVTPDFATIGKAIANGLPISAIVGPEKFMRTFDDIFFSSTFGGEITSIFAALKTIEIINRDNVYKEIETRGNFLKDGIVQLIKKHALDDFVMCKGLHHHFLIGFREANPQSTALKSLFQQECLKRGILFLGPHFVSIYHSQEVLEKTLKIYDQVMGSFSKSIASKSVEADLESDPIQPVFKARGR